MYDCLIYWLQSVPSVSLQAFFSSVHQSIMDFYDVLFVISMFLKCANAYIYIYMGKELKYRPGLKSEKGTAINLDET